MVNYSSWVTLKCKFILTFWDTPRILANINTPNSVELEIILKLKQMPTLF